jgi:hypothetical protein
VFEKKQAHEIRVRYGNCVRNFESRVFQVGIGKDRDVNKSKVGTVIAEMFTRKMMLTIELVPRVLVLNDGFTKITFFCLFD